MENWDGKGSKFKIRPECRYFQPWNEQTANKLVEGDMYWVPTIMGNGAAVWVARDQEIADNLKYFCHGHTFGTYEKFHYSVIEVGKVLEDEWVQLRDPLKVTRSFFLGEVSFESNVRELHEQFLLAAEMGLGVIGMGSDARGGIVHSFKVEQAVPLDKPFLDCAVSSKNTFGHFENSTTIRKQLELVNQISTMTFYGEIKKAGAK